MKVIEFLKDIFGDKETVYLTQKYESEKYKLAIEDFSIQMAINMIAGAIAKCEFKTYSKGKETKGDEYYIWNVEPNYNQNSSQFTQEFISKLLYYNECLIVEVGGKLIIADDFTQNEFALYPNTFTNVSRGDFTFDRTFGMQDVLYFKYGNQDIRALLSNILSGYSDLLNMTIGKYKRSGGRKGTAKITKVQSGDKDYQTKLDEFFNTRMKSYFENENAVAVLPNGVEYQEISGEGSKKSTSEIVDIAGITKEAMSRAAQAFHIPPALLQGDIADVDKLVDELLTFGVDPLVDMIHAEINRKRYGKKAYLAGTFLKIDTTCIKHVDIFAIAEKADKLISDGLYSIDELRTKLSDVPLNTWWSQKHWMTKNYSELTAIEQPQNQSEKGVKKILNEILKSASISKLDIDESELALINKNTLKELTVDDVFTFKIAACGNEIDRDFEAFPTESLKKLATLLNGKTVMQDHNPKSENQKARIYNTEVVIGEGTAKTGEPYAQLIAHCYMAKTESNKDFIAEIEAGIKKEVSIGCQVGSVICSVCGMDNRVMCCPHHNGMVYEGQTCYKKLENPTDAYEVSFVAVPSQKDAGVTKSYGGMPLEPEKTEESKTKTVADLFKAAFKMEVTE